MISLRLQIISILFSFVYGIVVAFLINLFYKYLFLKRKIIRILFSFLFIIFLGLLYFICLRNINNFYIHIYFLLAFLLGFAVTFSLFKRKIRK